MNAKTYVWKYNFLLLIFFNLNYSILITFFEILMQFNELLTRFSNLIVSIDIFLRLNDHRNAQKRLLFRNCRNWNQRHFESFLTLNRMHELSIRGHQSINFLRGGWIYYIPTRINNDFLQKNFIKIFLLLIKSRKNIFAYFVIENF